MAMILDAFLSKFGEQLAQMVNDEAVMLLGIPGQIEKLGQTVGDIQRVLADAEKKQSVSNTIKQWLMELKDVMYDADDIIDLCQIKAKERYHPGSSSRYSPNACCGSTLLSCFRNPFFAHKIGSQIKEINSRLEGIAKRKADLGLIESQIITHGPFNQVPRMNSIISRKTDPVIVMDDIVGEKIEEDARLLVSWLTEEESSGVRGNIVVVAIVGMGGIGKTTLAKRIFNDTKIDEEFELKIWTCISKEVKGVELLQCIIREAGGEHGAAQERSELVPLLQRVIKGKKFFLVLDDVWPESLAVWDGLLRDPMSGGAKGSRLLVSTRDETIAEDMRATKSHHVNKMSDQDGLCLLIKQVFENERESEIQQFKNIGLELVKKCDGLPLAIKSIGGVLRRRERTIAEWKSVLKSNAWSINGLPSGIHQAFYLSYEDLPSHLKQCFIFCSHYPEDHEFSMTELIYLWCAEGFLQDNEDLWELGNEYYRELLSRNLLETIQRSESVFTVSKMHDLLWSFACYLGKDENFVLREGEVLNREKNILKLRRLSIKQKEVNSQLFEKEKWLRTLFINDIPQNALIDLFTTLRNLRILEFKDSNITTLPNSIGVLKQLRYLRVWAKIITIPDSIGHLKNLICLNVSGCSELQHIPSSIINLKHLRHFCFLGTKAEGIPAGLKNLEKLIQLCGFKPSKSGSDGFSSLDELESLTHLITLYLLDLERISDKNSAMKAKLQCKTKLEALTLQYTTMSWEDQLSQTSEKKAMTEYILNELCPPPSVKYLNIGYYFGTRLPNWLNLGISLPYLGYLVITNCNCFENIPALGQLPNLIELFIDVTYSVHKVGEAFLWGDIKSSNLTSPAFPKLNKLTFQDVPNWKEWQWNKGETAMPKLKELLIIDCAQLVSLPDGLLHNATFLENLKIIRANTLTTVGNLPFIKEIKFSGNLNLERISNMPRVSNILIRDCPNLETVDNLDALQRMTLQDSEMKVLPEYLMAVTLQKLRIYCSEDLLRKITSQGENGSEWHKFNHIPRVTIYSLDGSLYTTYQKEPFSFTTNIRP